MSEEKFIVVVKAERIVKENGKDDEIQFYIQLDPKTDVVYDRDKRVKGFTEIGEHKIGHIISGLITKDKHGSVEDFNFSMLC